MLHLLVPMPNCSIQSPRCSVQPRSRARPTPWWEQQHAAGGQLEQGQPTCWLAFASLYVTKLSSEMHSRVCLSGNAPQTVLATCGRRAGQAMARWVSKRGTLDPCYLKVGAAVPGGYV